MQLKIGIACYPTFGGSGVVATELGISLAARGHEVHFVTYEQPTRLQGFYENVYFHNVDVMPYPLFTYPPYSLALAAKMAEVARYADLDVLHVHYAVPHATSALLTKQMIAPRPIGIVTTLHGTDITLVGSNPSYLPVTRFSIERSDAVTAVSDWLRQQTVRKLGVERPIEVIHNFVDSERFKPDRKECLLERFAPAGEKILMHTSNFRPLKRTADLLDIFDAVRDRADVKMILVGDGPDRAELEARARAKDRSDDIVFLGNYAAIEELLPCADVFLLPSSNESFGLAALEAMSCGVPVVASRVGGLPEVVDHGKTGYLLRVGDAGAMAEAAIGIVTSEDLRKKMGAGARAHAIKKFNVDSITRQYEQVYERLVEGS